MYPFHSSVTSQTRMPQLHPPHPASLPPNHVKNNRSRNSLRHDTGEEKKKGILLWRRISPWIIFVRWRWDTDEWNGYMESFVIVRFLFFSSAVSCLNKLFLVPDEWNGYMERSYRDTMMTDTPSVKREPERAHTHVTHRMCVHSDHLDMVVYKR